VAKRGDHAAAVEEVAERVDLHPALEMHAMASSPLRARITS